MRHAKRLDFDLSLRVIAREAVAVVNDQLMQELEQVTRAPQFFQGMDQIRVADTLIDQISQIDPVSGTPGGSAATESGTGYVVQCLTCPIERADEVLLVKPGSLVERTVSSREE